MVTNKKEIYLTKAGFELLKKELSVLKIEKRPEIVQQIKEARDLGDLSENAEYDSAMNEQAKLEQKIKELEYTINNSVIIEEKKSSKVKLGSTVSIKYLDDGEIETYKIVGSVEADPFNNLISNESEMGKSILDQKVGNIVDVKSPNGTYQIQIEKIN